MADDNGKKVAIDFLTHDVGEIFNRLRKLETEGCTVGNFVRSDLGELKQDQKKNRVLLLIILFILAARLGPDIIGWIIRAI
ncbi:MAG: hypothetical protein JXR73_09715 [Candidatus Omnitrophica bacterium]|nr:hypothetical protein [Candidatus Omnitrophota bacterium]